MLAEGSVRSSQQRNLITTMQNSSQQPATHGYLSPSMRKFLAGLGSLILWGFLVTQLDFFPGTVLTTVIVMALLGMYKSLARKKIKKTLGAVASVHIGSYLVGLPNVDQVNTKIEALVTEQDFTFIDALGNQLDSIPRNSINQIFAEDKSQISQRLTVTRLVTLGIFALAAPKKRKHKEFCVAIDWDDTNGMKQNTVFQFSGVNSSTEANTAANTLKKYVLPKATTIRTGEKKCPSCAEVIKAEAKICRYCHQAV